MCYELQISTDTPIDLSSLNKFDVFFENDDDFHKELQYPHKWRLATYAPKNCSCHFRIFEDELLESFGMEWCINEWAKETPNDCEVLNTTWLCQIIKNLVNQGYKLDSYIAEGYCYLDPITNRKTVNINDESNKNFVFLAYYHFDYK